MPNHDIIWQILPHIFEGKLESEISIPENLEKISQEEHELYQQSLQLFNSDFIQKEYAKGIMTQAGIIPLNDNYNPFDFVLGHTNFPVSHCVRSIVKKTEGVELFVPISPLRFKIAVGKYWSKQFKVHKVLENIEENLNKFFRILEIK